MYKKSRITALKHRATRQKRRERRHLARRLIKGDINLDQLGRLAGPSVSGVLRTVNYLSETEGTTLSPTLAQAVASAVAPVSSGTATVQRRVATPPRRPAARPQAAPASAAEPAERTEPEAVEAVVVPEAEPVGEAASAAEAEQPPAPSRRRTTRAAADQEGATPGEGEAASATPTRRRSTRAAASAAGETPEGGETPAPRRRAPRTAQS